MPNLFLLFSCQTLKNLYQLSTSVRKPTSSLQALIGSQSCGHEQPIDYEWTHITICDLMIGDNAIMGIPG